MTIMEGEGQQQIGSKGRKLANIRPIMIKVEKEPEPR